MVRRETRIRLGDLEIQLVPQEDAMSALRELMGKLAGPMAAAEELLSIMDDVGLASYQLTAPEESPIVFRFSVA
ncbi:MAG: hypothetical protein ACTSVD_08940 [Candidatus Thorarchaeota archaeon]